MTAGSVGRGKKAEGLVAARLKDLSTSKHVTFWRVPDAHAGSMQPALADFILFHYGQTTIIEVKQTEMVNRLPHGNFDAAQVARMRALTWAGVNAIVLIYHSKADKWRGYQVDRFLERDGGSWDLSDQEPTTLEKLLEQPVAPYEPQIKGN